MKTKGIIKTGEYFDSVSLMIVSQELNKIEGIKDASIIMGTEENKSILKIAGLFVPEFEKSSDTDMLISVKAENEAIIEDAFKKVDDLLINIRKQSNDDSEFVPKSLSGAIKQLPEANLCLISVAGKYAVKEAQVALENNLNVMLFSDNISKDDELQLKKYAHENNLLVMGPDCGTAIINQVPLAFANVVNKGNIGIVAASGTGLQEVSSIISNNGAGISQAIGTGGRDLKKEIGGITFIDAIELLKDDSETDIIVLVSKPPDNEVLAKISEVIKEISKPVIGIFLGGNSEILKDSGAIPANNLEEAALFATFLSQNIDIKGVEAKIKERNTILENIAQGTRPSVKGKYIRGLFSGGTLSTESQIILEKYAGNIYSNSPLKPDYKLKDVLKSQEHTIIDMGEDEFTSGRPHPMIDFSLRNKRIIQEAKDPETAIILLDVVLGYGSNLKPDQELMPIIKQAKEIDSGLVVICSITGTNKDPQNRQKVKDNLKSVGAIILPTNVGASILTGEIIKLIS